MAEAGRIDNGEDRQEKPELQGRRGRHKRPGIRKKLTPGRMAQMMILLVILVFNIATLVQMFTTFDARVSSRIHLNEITSIEVTTSEPFAAEGERQVTVTDPAEIAEIMNAFAGVRLRSSYASHDFSRSYWMRIYVNKEYRFLIRVDDAKYISINDSFRRDKYSSGSFKIINHYDIQSIDRLFP